MKEGDKEKLDKLLSNLQIPMETILVQDLINETTKKMCEKLLATEHFKELVIIYATIGAAANKSYEKLWELLMHIEQFAIKEGWRDKSKQLEPIPQEVLDKVKEDLDEDIISSITDTLTAECGKIR